MPAADITNVSVTFHNEVRGREEYNPPMRKAEVSLTALVAAGEDGVVAMNYISTLARAKVADLLGMNLPPEAAALIGGSDTGLEPGLNGGAPAPLAPPPPPATAPRTRRTKEQIAADEAAAAAAKQAASTGAASTTADQTASGQPAAGEDWSEPEAPLPPTSSASQGSEWDDAGSAAAPAPAPVSDADMAMHCSKHAQRLGGGDKVKAEIVKFKPEGWAQPKFGVTDIPQPQRPAFVAALEALT